MTGNAGSVEIDGENYIFEITNERTLYPVGSVDILIGSVRIVYETPVFPIKVKIGDIQNIIDSYGVYPISVRAIDTSDRIRVIDQYYTLNVVEESETIPSVSELPVLVDVSDPAHSPDVDPEPDPGEVEEGETYYNENNKRLFVYNGTSYDKITYEGDAPTAHTHGGNDITGKVANATTADSANSVEWSNVQNPPATYAPSAHTHGNSEITDLDASKITSGTINIARIPAGSLERLYPVSSLTEMYQLTTDDVQNGDTVQVNNGIMYRVVDDTNLDNSNGYKEYTAGRATAVDWSGVENPPATYTPSAHTHTGNEITSAVDTANKLGSSTVGSSTNPIYLNNGVATACGFSIVKVSSEPVNPDSNTIYIIVQ